MSQEFRLYGGSSIGHHHARLHRNNQDAYQHMVIQDGGTKQQIYIGVVSDGCGAGAHSEVGAQLLTRFIAEFLARYASIRSVIDLPSDLFSATQRYLERIINYQFVDLERTQFIHDYFLATIHAFFMDNEQCVVLSSGDGLTIHNEKIIEHQPTYLTYSLLDANDKMDLGDTIVKPMEFQVLKFPSNDIQRLVIATDGFDQSLLSLLDRNHGKKDFQWKLNKAFNEGRLFDDCTAVILERKWNDDNRAE